MEALYESIGMFNQNVKDTITKKILQHLNPSVN